MQGIASEKVPGGKLLRIKVDYDTKINDVKITGDFFLHPEESLVEIEKNLLGISKDESFENLAAKIKQVVNTNNIVLIGITEESIAKILKEAMK